MNEEIKSIKTNRQTKQNKKRKKGRDKEEQNKEKRQKQAKNPLKIRKTEDFTNILHSNQFRSSTNCFLSAKQTF